MAQMEALLTLRPDPAVIEDKPLVSEIRSANMSCEGKALYSRVILG